MKVSHWFGNALVGARRVAVTVALTVFSLGGAAFAATPAEPKTPATAAKATETTVAAKADAKAPVIDWSKTVKLPKPMKIGKVKSVPANLKRDARFIGSAGQPAVLAGIAGAVALGIGASSSRGTTATGGIPSECAEFIGTFATSMVTVTGPDAAVAAHIQDQFANRIIALNASGTISGGFLSGSWTCGQPDADTLSIVASHSLVPLTPPPVDYEFVPNSDVALDSNDASPIGTPPLTFTATGTIDVIALIDDDNNPATARVVDPGASGIYSITAITLTKQ